MAKQTKSLSNTVVLNFGVYWILLKCNFDSVVLGWGLRFNISNELSDNVDTSGSQTNRLAKKKKSGKITLEILSINRPGDII